MKIRLNSGITYGRFFHKVGARPRLFLPRPPHQGGQGDEYPDDIHHGRRDRVMVQRVDHQAGAPSDIQQVIGQRVGGQHFIYIQSVGQYDHEGTDPADNFDQHKDSR
jgi:hypothetical protein